MHSVCWDGVCLKNFYKGGKHYKIQWYPDLVHTIVVLYHQSKYVVSKKQQDYLWQQSGLQIVAVINGSPANCC